MEVVDARRDHLTLGVAPGSLADAIPGIDSFGAASLLSAEIGAPIGDGGPGGFGQCRAMGIGTVQAAEVGAVALADAGDEERHGALLLGAGAGCDAGGEQRRRDGETHRSRHYDPPSLACAGLVNGLRARLRPLSSTMETRAVFSQGPLLGFTFAW